MTAKTASVFTAAPSVVSCSSFQKCTASVSRSWSSLELGLADTGIGFWYSPLRQRRPWKHSGAVFNSGANGQGAPGGGNFPVKDGVIPSTHRQRSTMGACTRSSVCCPPRYVASWSRSCCCCRSQMHLLRKDSTTFPRSPQAASEASLIQQATPEIVSSLTCTRIKFRSAAGMMIQIAQRAIMVWSLLMCKQYSAKSEDIC